MATSPQPMALILCVLLAAFGPSPSDGVVVSVQDTAQGVQPHVPQELGDLSGSILKGLKPGDKKPKPANDQLTPDDPHDPRDPRAHDFVPRLGPDEGGDQFVFGHVNAALRHVIKSTKAGDPVAAADELDAFSAKHELGLSLAAGRAIAVEAAVRKATAELLVNGTAQTSAPRGLHVLVLGAGIGASTLRCLPVLLENATAPDSPHELVSIEGDMHVSDTGSQLLKHALGEMHENRIRHLPLLPAEDTSLGEVLDSLRTGYELGPFDLVLLEGRDREKHITQVKALVRDSALRNGAVVHAEGPGRGDTGTERLIELLEGGDGAGRFDYDVHDKSWPGPAAAIIATWRGRHKSEL